MIDSRRKNLLILLLALCVNTTLSLPQVPAMFVFGDSLIDDGNNNVMTSIAKANYFPYGVDFSQGPTGRFTNGKTIIDFLCERLGLPYAPPYTSPGLNGSKLLAGVNYASAAAGILDESGQFLGERFSLSQQVINFENNLNEIRDILGDGKNLSQYLGRSIAVVVLGSNDYINNYLLPGLYTSSYNYSPQEYADLLINHLTRQLLCGIKEVFDRGVGPLGCIPNQRASGFALPGRCVEQVNQMVGLFNDKLRQLVQQLNTNHPGAIFVYGNTYGAIGDILNNPSQYGFSVTDRGCCGIGKNHGQLNCLPLQVPCQNRSEYVFWDAYHPTEAIHKILAQRAYTGGPSDCYPVNVQQLAQL